MPNSTTFGQPAPSDPKPGTQQPSADGATQAQTPTPTVAAPNAVVTPGAGPQAQNVGTGFVNLQSLLMANAPAAQGMAQGLVNNAYSQGQAAQKSGSLDDAKKASDTANGLGTFGGIQSQLMGQYGKNAYSGGQAGFDALLAGTAGQQAFQSAQQAYGGLYNQLLGQSATQGPATPPAKLKATDTSGKPTVQDRIDYRRNPYGKPKRDF